MKQAIVNCTIHTGDEIINDGIIIIENGIITSVDKIIPENTEQIDLKGLNIAAGFIDIHINGGEKFYFSQFPTEESIHDIYTSSLQYGTTHVLPCLITSSHENILKGIEAIKNYRSKYNNGVLGMHLEGPFINPVKRGAHLAEQCFEDEQLDMLMESGFVISAGHSNMTYKQAQHYFSKGITLITHLFNAMTQFGHREPGLVGAIFSNDTVYSPIILDGVHCDYAAAKLAYQLKKDKLILISDALFLSRKVESFKWGAFDAHLVDGYYKNSEGNLAGATISMAEAVQNAVKHLNVSVSEAIQMATCRVAAAINMDNEIGKIKPGMPATFVKFSNDLKLIESIIL